ncbi:MAG: ankyrin repeat domain-containing protein, partial [Planctomycetota bacterium]
FETIEELAQLVQQVVAGRFTRRTAPVRRRLLLHRRRAIDRWQQNIFRESHAGVHDHRPVHYAVVANQIAVAQLLIERGASIQPYSKKLIEVASEYDDGQMLALLLDHGADLGAAADPSWADDPRLMALVEQVGFTLDFHREAGRRPALVEACTANMNARDDPSRVQAILDRGCPVDIRDRHGKTGLHRAARAGFVKIPRLLLQQGADLEAVDHAGETPLFDAVRAGRLAVTKLLVQAGASLKVRNAKGTGVAEVAQRARRNDAAAFRAWLQRQID